VLVEWRPFEVHGARKLEDSAAIGHHDSVVSDAHVREIVIEEQAHILVHGVDHVCACSRQ
jgi:hypothetical protein